MGNPLYIIDFNKLDNSYKNTLDFEDKEEQEAFFDDHVVDVFEADTNKFTFIRPERGEVRVRAEFNALKYYSYMMFENDDTAENKRYYAFITDIEYLNPKTVRISFEVDVLQTYLFDFEVGHSFVVREHQDRLRVEVDQVEEKPVIKRNFQSVQEDINIGTNYKENETQTLFYEQPPEGAVLPLIITATEYLNDEEPSYGGGYPIPTGVIYYLTFVQVKAFDYTDDVRCDVGPIKLIREHEDEDDDDYGMQPELSEIVEELSSDTRVFAINILPHPFFDVTFTYDEDANGNRVREVTIRGDDDTIALDSGTDIKIVGQKFDIPFLTLRNIEIAKEKVIGQIERSQHIPDVDLDFDYTNRDLQEGEFEVTVTKGQRKTMENESKLFVDPYFFYKVYRNQAVYKDIMNEYLKSDDTDITYNVALSLNIRERVEIDTDQEFAHINNNQNSELPMTYEQYEEYMRRNKTQSTVGLLSAGAQLAGGVALTATGAGSAIGGGLTATGGMSLANQIATEFGKREDLKRTPDEVRHEGNDIAFEILTGQLHYRVKSFIIHERYQRRLASYLERFGYRVGEYKKPDLKSRYYFDYIETRDTYIETSLNNRIRQKIEEIHEAGVTYWHYNDNEDDLFDYDVENFETSLEGLHR